MRFDYDYVFSYARARDWQVQLIDYMNAAVSRYWGENAAPQPNIEEILNFWRPDGCIVECGGIPHEPWEHLFKGIPTVYLDRPQPEDDPDAVCVSDDTREVAAVAARELLAFNFDEYAFVAFYNPLPWNEGRGKWFRHFIMQNGKRCETFRMPKPESGGQQIEAVAKFLCAIPKPCGVFSASDETARTIVNACTRMNIAIPDEIALVSVDNDVEICELLPVTVTSIELDHAAAIRKSIELLDEIMSAPQKHVQSTTFGVKRIVRRTSANGVRNIDRRVAAAMEYIRVNASMNIKCTDIIDAMGCSERFGNMLFRKFRGHTILDEIHLTRIELAKEHLHARVNSIETIAGICGYESPSDFGRVFKRYTNLTPREWQRKYSVF